MPWQRRRAPDILLVCALASASILIIVLCWNQTFFQDAWAFLLERRGHTVGDFLRPHNEHLVVIPVLITKVCENVFGLTNTHPEIILMAASLALTAAFLYVYVRRRVGSWLALAAVLPVMFLGSSWMIILWPFEIVFSGSVAAGLGALLLLEREDRVADAWACVLVVISIGFGSLGLSFALAAVVAVWQTRRTSGWGRAYVVIVPGVLYLAWYAGWGHTAEHHLTLTNVLTSPLYVMEGFAAAAASLFGLNTESGAATAEPVWGRAILPVLIGLAVFWKWRRPGLSPFFWRTVAAVGSYWLLAGFSYIPGREAASNRYVYAGVIFLLMMAADLFDGARLGKKATAVVLAVAACAVLPNIALMKEGSEILETQSQLTRAATAGIEIARRTIPPDLVMGPELTGTLATVTIIPGPYLEVSEENGSSAYTPEELLEGPPLAQHQVDVFLSKVLPLSLEVLPNRPSLSGSCTAVGGSSPGSETELGPGEVLIAAAPQAEARLTARRFSPLEFPVELGTVPAGAVARLKIPADEAPQPWYVKVEAAESARVCGKG